MRKHLNISSIGGTSFWGLLIPTKHGGIRARVKLDHAASTLEVACTDADGSWTKQLSCPEDLADWLGFIASGPATVVDYHDKRLAA